MTLNNANLFSTEMRYLRGGDHQERGLVLTALFFNKFQLTGSKRMSDFLIEGRRKSTQELATIAHIFMDNNNSSIEQFSSCGNGGGQSSVKTFLFSLDDLGLHNKVGGNGVRSAHP